MLYMFMSPRVNSSFLSSSSLVSVYPTQCSPPCSVIRFAPLPSSFSCSLHRSAKAANRHHAPHAYAVRSCWFDTTCKVRCNNFGTYRVFESFEDNAAQEKQPALCQLTAQSRNLAPKWLKILVCRHKQNFSILFLAHAMSTPAAPRAGTHHTDLHVPAPFHLYSYLVLLCLSAEVGRIVM